MRTSEVRVGDCVEVMAAMPEASVDAICTDPPYHLSFMGRSWDHAPTGAESQAMHEAWAREALRVLKPGGHLLAFGGTRTFHRLTCAIEDVGFEIRDCLSWMYGSGFPKSHNVALSIDKMGGTPDRGRAIPAASTHFPNGRYADGGEKLTSNPVEDYEARSDEAREWEGWGTALKPSWEPIVLARKPLVGTVAANVTTHGTGALNIDGCRVGTAGATRKVAGEQRDGSVGVYGDGLNGGGGERDLPLGRWPANTVLSHSEGCVRIGERRVRAAMGTSKGDPDGKGIYGKGFPRGDGREVGYAEEDGYETTEAWECVEGCPVAELDRQSGESKSSGGRTANVSRTSTIYGGGKGLGQDIDAENVKGDPGFGDKGGASRFFYTAKASRAERNAGLDGFAEGKPHDNAGHTHTDGRAWDIPGSLSTPRANVHPTVKPIDLMRWLVRLVTPPGGTVCDPFVGSGTTGVACALEGIDFIGIEREQEYVQIAEARIEWWARHPEGTSTKDALKASKATTSAKAVEQEILFA